MEKFLKISVLALSPIFAWSCATKGLEISPPSTSEIEFPKLAEGYDWSPTEQVLKGKLLLRENCIVFKERSSIEHHVVIWPPDANLIIKDNVLKVISTATSLEKTNMYANVGSSVRITGNIVSEVYDSGAGSITSNKKNETCAGNSIVHAHFWASN